MADELTPTPSTPAPNPTIDNLVDRPDPAPSPTSPKNVDQEFQIGDRVWKASELVERNRQFEEMQSKLDELSGFREKTQSLLRSDDLATVKEAGTAVYRALGMSDEEIAKELSHLDPQPADPAKPAATPEQKMEDPRFAPLAQLTEQKIEADTKTAIRNALDKSDKVQKVMKHLKSLGEEGEKRAAAIYDRLATQAFNQTATGFNEHSKKTGELSYGALEKLTQDNVMKVQSDLDLYFGDTATLGRSAEDVQAAAALREVLEAEPSTINLNEIDSVSGAKQTAREVTTDRLSRMVAELAAEETGIGL